MQLFQGPGLYLRTCVDDTDLCGFVSMGDFILNAWQLEGQTNELLAIYIEINPDGLISEITDYPDGTVTDGEGNDYAVQWNGTTYESVSGPDILTGVCTLVIPGMTVTLTNGQSCSDVTFTQVVNVGDTNTGPVASNVAISGTLQQGQTLTCTYDYSDPDGDPEDVLATTINWYSYTDSGGTTAETLIGSGANYVLTSSEVGKYIRTKVTPYALSGLSPGATTNSAVTERVYTNQTAFTFTSNKTTGLTVTTTGGSGAVDWGDGTVTTYSGSAVSHTYASAGTYTITMYSLPGSITMINLINQGVITANLSPLTSCTSFSLQTNSAMTAVTLPNSGTLSLLNVSNSLITTLDFNNLVFSSAEIRADSTNLATVDESGVTGTFSYASFQSTKLTGTFNWRVNSAGSGTQFIVSGSTGGVTSINHGSATGNISRWQVDLTTLTGNQDIPYSFVSSPVFILINSTGITNATFAGTGAFIYFAMNGTGIGYPSLGAITFTAGASVFVQNCGMTATEVNDWLIALDGGKIPSVAVVGNSLRFDGTNAAPTGAGATAKTNLIGKGYTVTTN